MKSVQYHPASALFLSVPVDNQPMQELDWDDPTIEKRSCAECRQLVTNYLAREGLTHGEIGSWPAWHVAPYVSLWAVESLRVPGTIGWWAICGDLPTDYLAAATAKHPRTAMLAFADIWKDKAQHMRKGIPHPDLTIGPPEQQSELASLLQRRSDTLRLFAEDDAVWGPDYG
jgi:hypothetical protein